MRSEMPETDPNAFSFTQPRGGIEIFFARCAEEFAKPSGPDMDRIIQISREHGIEYA